MPVTPETLEKLAAVYGVTKRHLEFEPAAAELVTFLARADAIIRDLSPAALEHWLALGDQLRRR